MNELALDVCQAEDTVYLTLGQAGGEVLGPEAGPSWLVLNEGLYIDVTRDADPQKRPVIARVQAEDLPQAENGGVLVRSASLVAGTEIVPLSPKVRRLGPEDKIKGHVAGVSGGAIQGWVTDQTGRAQEVPVEIAFQDQTLITMSKGKWHGDVPRAFSVPLPTKLPQRRPVLVTARAMPGGAPFGRTPFYLTLTSIGWLLATPLRHEDSVLAGEFLLAPVPNKPVTVTLKLADGRSLSAECSEKTEVQFGGRPCGFTLEGLSGADLAGGRLSVAHDSLGGADLEFDLETFFA